MNLAILDKHIVATPGVCGGKPRIAGRRISVQHVAVWHEYEGRSAADIASEYALSLGDVYAALTYYYDYQDEIDQQIANGKEMAEHMRQQTPSLLQEKLGAEALEARRRAIERELGE